MASRKEWDHTQFNQVNLPEVVGTFKGTNYIGTRVLDMPVHIPGQGMHITNEVIPYLSLIHAVAMHEKQYGGIDDMYVYITIDQKHVSPGKTARRAGAHSDAYIESKGRQIDLTTHTAHNIIEQKGQVSHTYVWYDSIPTEFFDVPFPLVDASDSGSLKTFEQIADANKPVTYPTHTLLKMDPYVVHRCGICQEETDRTFVKISVSDKKYARKGNTINHMFDYDWTMKDRSDTLRNDPF